MPSFFCDQLIVLYEWKELVRNIRIDSDIKEQINIYGPVSCCTWPMNQVRVTILTGMRKRKLVAENRSKFFMQAINGWKTTTCTRISLLTCYPTEHFLGNYWLRERGMKTMPRTSGLIKQKSENRYLPSWVLSAEQREFKQTIDDIKMRIETHGSANLNCKNMNNSTPRSHWSDLS